MSVTKDLIERMHAVGDVHDRRMAELAIEEYDAQAAALDAAREFSESMYRVYMEYKEDDKGELTAYRNLIENKYLVFVSALAALGGQEAGG